MEILSKKVEPQKLRNENGLSALSFAVDKELYESFQFLLLFFEASINEKDGTGMTPLHYAVLVEN